MQIQERCSYRRNHCCCSVIKNGESYIFTHTHTRKHTQRTKLNPKSLDFKKVGDKVWEAQKKSAIAPQVLIISLIYKRKPVKKRKQFFFLYPHTSRLVEVLVPPCHLLHFCNSIIHYLEVIREVSVLLNLSKITFSFCSHKQTFNSASPQKKLKSSGCSDHLKQKALPLTHLPLSSAPCCMLLSFEQAIPHYPLISKISYKHAQIPYSAQRILDDYRIGDRSHMIYNKLL